MLSNEGGSLEMEARTMKKRFTIKATASWSVMLLVAALLAGPLAGAASAQDESATQVRARTEARLSTQTPQGDALRQRISERIEGEQGLQAQEREQLRLNLGECKKLGLGDAATGALFSEDEPLRNQIRTQARVLAMAREGLPVEPVMEKLQEGRRKGASAEALEKVCTRMEEQVRAANRYMMEVRKAGATPGNADAERTRTAEMARHMFNGVGQGDLDQLRERVRARLRDGSCATEDCVAAAEAMVKFRSMGVESERAARMAGEALQNGYTAREMRQFSWMVMAAKSHGGPQNEVLDTVERGIRNQYRISDMVREMYRYGWMGPGDERGGYGGNDPSGGAGGRRGGTEGGQGGGSDDTGHHGG